ncbi:fibrobacter succinogenes major paralogous domain-containing protein [uncultured Fibrobacter sp.]|uniref:fibrobacter succinogenes major paralogous domain-containing protein n=1 Tax=uncultured Fibrobacter sp. TaxID=261512 RepID=UPI0026138644|nr:fibrobacter succinogenes major paralogous domain-containing protein [uncultured Fibrobacter sp.]
MKNGKKYIFANLQNAGATISFTLLLFTAFLAACATPTVSSDDSDDGINSLSSAELKESFFNPDIDYGSMTDSRDGQVYRTVQIGEQTWMAENLNFDPGQGGSRNANYDWSWCYENDPEKCELFGRFYTWAAAVDSIALYDGGNGVDCGDGKTCILPEKVQGVCPDGWHLPTKDEWNILFSVVGGQDNAGKVLRSQTGWYKGSSGTDDVGFCALPTGTGGDDRFLNFGNRADFWVASEHVSDRGCNVIMHYFNDKAGFGNAYKHAGLPVRCVKD